MKRVVSVSLGSSKRNHAASVTFMGETIQVERIGTDGSMEKTIALIRSLDGEVDAFGMGGIDLYIWAGGRRYTFRDARRIARAAQRTPIVDGSGLKHTLERQVIRHLDEQRVLPLRGTPVLLTSAVDRFGMAEALVTAGADVTFGDFIFALGLPIPLKSMRQLTIAARLLLPWLTQLPFQWLYPTGEKQEKVNPRFSRYYTRAEAIAGDFHFIRRYMPPDLTGKAVITNTVTAADVEELRRRGVRLLVTTTPNLEGRSFGTNVMEALIVALAGKPADQLQVTDYEEWLQRIGFTPRVEWLQEGQQPAAVQTGSN